MKTGKRYLCLSALICGSTLVARAETWLRLKSPHFEMLTTAGEKKGREAILYFEAVRGFFHSSGTIRESDRKERPVRIIAFRSPKEFEPYKLNQFSSAYYLAGWDTDTIVMSGIERDRYPAAVHEYTHLIIHRSGLNLPVWLNEGLADLYSSLQPQGSKIRVGDLLPGRVQRLQRSRLIPLEELVAVDHSSPWYNERQRASVFYAESWALTHMLALSQEYRRRFPEFVVEVAAKRSLEAALKEAFGKTVREVETDLTHYFSGRLIGSLLDAKLDPGSDQATIDTPADVETQVALAEVLASSKRTSAAGRARYEKLQKQYPDSPMVEAGLGRVFLREKNHEEARRHFSRAVELGARDSRVFFDYAMLLRGRAGDQQAVELLRKALDLDPDFEDAHYHLGFVLLRQNQFREALAEFAKVRHVKAEDAFEFYRATAGAWLRLGDRESARVAAERAQTLAVSDEDKQAIGRLLASIGRLNR